MLNVNKIERVEILLVEDNPGDVLLTRRFLEKTRIMNTLHVVEDGFDAILFLRGNGKYTETSMPDLILRDMNLRGKDRREVLKEVKADKHLCHIPCANIIAFYGGITTIEKIILPNYKEQPW